MDGWHQPKGDYTILHVTIFYSKCQPKFKKINKYKDKVQIKKKYSLKPKSYFKGLVTHTRSFNVTIIVFDSWMKIQVGKTKRKAWSSSLFLQAINLLI